MNNLGDTRKLPPPELVRRGQMVRPFYADARFLLPLLVAMMTLLGAASAFILCRRTRQERHLKEQLDNQQNAEVQRERYYATIHKVALEANSDKIPETSEDISPYATFQLSDPNNTLLHSFMYHEQAMTEGSASQPPPATSKIRRARRRSSRKTDAETDESESDTEQLTSSRTESSNQLEAAKGKHNFIYHGAQSSTSSDISPMSEQKSLPRRNGRSRWVSPGKSAMRTSMSVAETSFKGTPGRSSELSEAECDIDTLKKLKLGLRSSLWSRPTNTSNTQQSDYSIAV